MLILRPSGDVALGGAPSRVANSSLANSNPTGGVPATTRYQKGTENVGPPSSVIDVSQFPLGAVTLNFTLAQVDILAVTAPALPRRLLIIRNDISSTGGSYVYVAFGIAASPQTAAYSIPVNGTLTLDLVVPQDDIHLNSSATGVVAVLTYWQYQVPQA